ncbi:MAG: MarR family transcriptional regulator [Clostridia bacterium]|nr:MarR family transcriptional regulator [Clostridia bacterium]
MESNELFQTVQAICQTDRCHRAAIEARLADLGIHRTQHMVLMYLFRHEETATQREIAQEFRISQAAVSVTLNKLESAGYIKRESHDEDARANRIRLTPEGLKLIDRTHELFGQVDEEMFRGISREQLAEMRALLKRMRENLKGTAEEDKEGVL